MGSLLLLLTFYCITFVCLWILHHLFFFPYLPFTLLRQTHTTKRTNHTKITNASKLQCVTGPFAPIDFLQFYIAVSHWSGSRSLTFAILPILDLQWDFCGMSCCCPVSWRLCQIASARFAPSWSLAIQDRVYVGVYKLKSLDLGLDCGWVTRIIGTLRSYF